MVHTKTLDLIINLEFDFIDKNEKSKINRFVQLIKDFDISEAEKLITDDFNTEYTEFNKYHKLAALKKVLLEFRKKGDTELAFQKGQCKEKCFKRDNLYQLIGNNSGLTFDFGIIEEDGEIVNFHNCSGFIDQYGWPSNNYKDMQWTYMLKLMEFTEFGDQLYEKDIPTHLKFLKRIKTRLLSLIKHIISSFN